MTRQRLLLVYLFPNPTTAQRRAYCVYCQLKHAPLMPCHGSVKDSGADRVRSPGAS